ncbi:MAG: c-type cytochrome [Bdellovibrionales bacterium]|nr:c-type cytochrome [Bdellovibrionales bacterium]
MKTVAKLLIGIGWLAVLVNCSPEHNSSGFSAQSACNLVLEDVFKSQYQPFLVQNCNGCHASGGIGIGSFADSDPTVAFEQFRFRGDLINQRAVDPAHQAGITGPQHQPFIDSVSAQWEDANNQALTCLANATNPGEGGVIDDDPLLTRGSIFTGEQRIGASETSKTLTWNLGNDISTPSDVSLPGALFSIDVVTNTTPTGNTSYQFSNPKLNTGSDAVHLILIQVRINGQLITSATTYRGLNRRVPANSESDLSLTTMVVPFTFSANDTLSIAFGRLDVIDFNPLTYDQLIGGGGLIAQNCLGCHGSNNPSGGLDLTDRNNLIGQYVVAPYSPNSSEIFIRMNDDQRPMPPSGKLSQSDIDSIRDWIFAGAL